MMRFSSYCRYLVVSSIFLAAISAIIKDVPTLRPLFSASFYHISLNPVFDRISFPFAVLWILVVYCCNHYYLQRIFTIDRKLGHFKHYDMSGMHKFSNIHRIYLWIHFSQSIGEKNFHRLTSANKIILMYMHKNIKFLFMEILPKLQNARNL